MKEEFVSTVSHELRTPLTSIRGALALVMSGKAGELPEKAKSLLSVALRNSERLINIVNDILDAEKVESGKMRVNMQMVELAPLLEQTLAYNQPYAERFKVNFRLENAVPKARVYTDPDRLMQVITNLLSNAAKFSPPYASVILRASEEDGGIVVEVKDFGPGIPPEFQEHIFEKFAQAQNPGAERIEGAGLGLNLSRQLMELMQGSISFSTKLGEGTVFILRFPYASAVADLANARRSGAA